ncbi:hypothetical protein Tcan_03448 [Toxocara canis]|uniref:Uncharacterized protein n=1 Tax=Toxocara canis TaxID=6265 RepID=A0A0B2VJK6_TOXCA|nr:hypothetical protein Tcan_03448 [Toxocara canis]
MKFSERYIQRSILVSIKDGKRERNGDELPLEYTAHEKSVPRLSVYMMRALFQHYGGAVTWDYQTGVQIRSRIELGVRRTPVKPTIKQQCDTEQLYSSTNCYRRLEQ